MSNTKKSAEVRKMIHNAKTNGATQVSDELIKQVQENFGFTRQLARAYLQNNWDKVDASKPVDAIEKVRAPKAEKPAKVELTAEEKAAKVAAANAKRAATRAAKKAAAAQTAPTAPVTGETQPVSEAQPA